MPAEPRPTVHDPITDVKFYDPATNGYDLAKDPRCLWGWGDCGHRFGHTCFRPYEHPGRCWDGGDRPGPGDDRCATNQRPTDWDARGRAEANDAS